MNKRMNPHVLNDILRESRSFRPQSRQIERAMDVALTQAPRMSGARQTRVEMEIRDEIGRRNGYRLWRPF